jgi:hypothetical protein
VILEWGPTSFHTSQDRKSPCQLSSGGQG